MDIIETGYRYRVYDLKKANPQDITFTRRRLDGTFDPGTTNEELIDVLIARMYVLQQDNPSPENLCIVILLKTIRQILNRIVGKNIKKKNRYVKKDDGNPKAGKPAISVYDIDE